MNVPLLWADSNVQEEFTRLLVRKIRADSVRLRAEYAALPLWYRRFCRVPRRKEGSR